MLDRFDHFITAITQIDLYWHRIAASAMSEYGLKGNYAIYFTKLLNCEEGLTAAELSQLSGKDKADVSRDTSVLIKKGLMIKTNVGNNSYRARLTLTDEGVRLAGSIERKVREAVSMVGLIDDGENITYFYEMLDEITQKLRDLSSSSSRFLT